LFGFALFAPSAFALMLNFPTYANGAPAPAQALPAAAQPGPTVVHTIVTGGMAGWLISLVAIGAALFTATVAVLTDRARAARRSLTVSAA
jgi:MFS family permease